MSFVLGPLVPLFWISGDVSSGFQIQSGFCLIHFFAKVNVMYIPWYPPLVLHLPTSWQPAHCQSLPHMHVQWGDLVQIRMGNHPDRRRTVYFFINPIPILFLFLPYLEPPNSYSGDCIEGPIVLILNEISQSHHSKVNDSAIQGNGLLWSLHFLYGGFLYRDLSEADMEI